ncbi:MAG: EcsC family protein [Hyphomicrobiales bacterium]|nr:EcsC family protein [Hyphomicrobiales bacterium]
MDFEDRPSPMTPADQAALARAVEALERTSFAARVTGLLGRQLETAGKLLPARVSGVVSKAATSALKAATHVALTSLRNSPQRDSRAFHRALAAASGAAGGAFGLASLPVELPVSTTVMLRSIADIARAEGEDLGKPEAALACLQVFALGGHSAGPDMMDGGYFALRGVLAKSVSEAAAYVAQKSVVDESAPVMVRLMGQIASRFGLVVSQKAAAQAVPLVGAVAGAAINVAFTEHFQSLAKGHFTVRRLERLYSPDIVRREYERIAAQNGDAQKRSA